MSLKRRLKYFASALVGFYFSYISGLFMWDINLHRLSYFIQPLFMAVWVVVCFVFLGSILLTVYSIFGERD